MSFLVEANTPNPSTYNEHFGRRVCKDDFTYTQWVRSNFYPPAEDGASFTLPQHLYDAPAVQSRKATKH